jgi:ethanolamine utilization protein EutM
MATSSSRSIRSTRKGTGSQAASRSTSASRTPPAKANVPPPTTKEEATLGLLLSADSPPGQTMVSPADKATALEAEVVNPTPQARASSSRRASTAPASEGGSPAGSAASQASVPATPAVVGGLSKGSGGSSAPTPPARKGSSFEPFSGKGIALGLIETRGLVPAIEAADAMTKSAQVTLVAREFVGGGYVTVMVRGETGAVNAAVRAGADACERVGDGLVAAHIIARPHVELEPVLIASDGPRRL